MKNTQQGKFRLNLILNSVSCLFQPSSLQCSMDSRQESEQKEKQVGNTELNRRDLETSQGPH